jgi:hypothetical protein
MSRLLNKIDFSKLTRTVKTPYDEYECNTMLCLYNANNIKGSELKTFKEHPKLTNINSTKDIDIRSIIRQGMKICTTVSEEYLLDKMEDCKLIFLLFSRKPTKYELRNPKVIEKICGLVFLDVAPTFIYITLICAQRGLGRPLMNLVEEIAVLFGFNTIKLDSLDAPFPFYLRNNYRLDNGRGKYIISEDEESEPLYKPPEKEDIEKKYKAPYTGIIHTFKYGGFQPGQKSWIYVGDSTNYQRDKWKFIKPGYIVLYTREETPERVYYKPNKMFSDEVFKHLLSKNKQKSKFKVEDEHGNKLRLNKHAGLVTKLINVSTSGSEYIKMTKKLRVTMLGKKRRRSRKPNKKKSQKKK